MPAINPEHDAKCTWYHSGKHFLCSKEADIRCRSSSMEIKLSPESPTINNDITNQGMLRAKAGTASKEKPKKSTMSES